MLISHALKVNEGESDDEENIRPELACLQCRPSKRKNRILSSVMELCAGVAEPSQSLGRPRLPVADMLFCMALKIFTRMSGRRFIPDLKLAHARGFISRIPCYNSIFHYFSLEVLRSYLGQLITESSLPLKSVETNFAVDSTGFATSRF